MTPIRRDSDRPSLVDLRQRTSDEEWKSLQSSADSLNAAQQRLEAAYQSPGRYYHTFAHAADVARTVAQIHRESGSFDLFPTQLAAWYHDAIYDPRAQDNEARSAEFAEQELAAIRLADFAPRVAAMIRATQHHIADTPESAALLDADLRILTAPLAEYDHYSQAIRQEYAWVPDDAYRRGRAEVLRRFLARPRIFHTSFGQRLESAARENLRRELAALESSGPRI